VFTYRFLGLDPKDNPGPYYYGSLPAKPEHNFGAIGARAISGNWFVFLEKSGAP
jgi:hypothetical protein